MPYWFVGAFLVLYGVAYFVFAFVEPPSALQVLFALPPILSSNDTLKRIGRIVIGTVLMVGPLVCAYIVMRR